MNNQIQFGSEKVFWEISPCSWMYEYYGLQISIALGQKETDVVNKFINRKDIPWDNSKDMDAIALGLVEEYLAKNGTKELKQLQADWEKVKDEFEETRQFNREDDEEDARMKKKGFTHRMDSYIHPKSGDDIFNKVYMKEYPKQADIKKVLRKCQIKTDYRITEL